MGRTHEEVAGWSIERDRLMAGKVQIRFIEDGNAENPLAPRAWSFVPRVGETVFLPETRRVHRVRSVQWSCAQRSDGTYNDDEPLVIIRVED